MRTFVFALLLAVSAVSSLPFPNLVEYVKAKTYNVSLDLPPEERWTEICSHYKSSASLLVKYLTKDLSPGLAQIVATVAGAVNKYLGEYGQEMSGIAKAVGLPIGDIVGLNFAYELRKLGPGHPNTTGGSIGDEYTPQACTSIVAVDENDSLFHGRNMDWDMPNYLRNLTILVNFHKGGKLLYTATTFAGYVGVMTAVKPGAYSVSLNERALGGSTLVDILSGALFGASAVTHKLRQVFEEESTYAGAIGALSKGDVMAPAYFIVAGTKPGEGAVMTRDRDSVRDLWSLGTIHSNVQSWYILETNYDHWESPPSFDDRRSYGVQFMNAMGRKSAASLDGIFTVLGRQPVNNNYTTYTALMNPAQGEITTYIVYGI